MRLTRIRATVAAGLLVTAITAGAIGPTAGSAMAGTGVPARAVPVSGAQLFGVAATSARNAWAVGGEVSSDKTIILHWNGTTWTRVPSPTPVGLTELYAVAATSARNAWAVGGGGAAPGKTIILRWNGTAWRPVPSPTPKGGGALFGVAATSARNVWAVGCTGHCFGPMATTTTMIVHWNGTDWRLAASPNPAPNSVLTAVAATSASHAWAVGYTRTGFKTLIAHWNGSHWTRVPSPTPGPFSQLFGVAATSTRNAWAAGADEKGGILQHWNGTTWK
jgi:hypothetical protein